MEKEEAYNILHSCFYLIKNEMLKSDSLSDSTGKELFRSAVKEFDCEILEILRAYEYNKECCMAILCTDGMTGKIILPILKELGFDSGSCECSLPLSKLTPEEVFTIAENCTDQEYSVLDFYLGDEIGSADEFREFLKKNRVSFNLLKKGDVAIVKKLLFNEKLF